jgi:5'-nucleotidase
MARVDRSNQNIFLFDLDGSLADYQGALRRDLKKLRMPGEPKIEDLFYAEKRYKPIAARMRLIKAQTGWWLRLKPIPMGLQIFHAAGEMGFEREVLTKGPHKHPVAWGEKFIWVKKHLDVNITITEFKGRHYGKVLYDDFPPYIRDWLEHRPNGLVIMPDTPWNLGFTHPRVVRWTGKNEDEVLHAMRCAYDRVPGEPLVF